MDIVDKLPGMENASLEVLHANAERLQQTGTKAQKSAAAALLPALEIELESRRAAKLVETAAKRAAVKRPPTKKAAKASADAAAAVDAGA